jgi:hypothetical protein
MRAPQALSAVVLLVGTFQVVLLVEAAAWILPLVARKMIIDTCQKERKDANTQQTF